MLNATLRARLRKTALGALPTTSRKIRAEPSGLMTGSSALNASTKYLRTSNIAWHHTENLHLVRCRDLQDGSGANRTVSALPLWRKNVKGPSVKPFNENRLVTFCSEMAICTRAWGDAYDEPALNGDREPIRRQSDVNARREGFIATTFELVLGTSRCSASPTLLANRSRR